MSSRHRGCRSKCDQTPYSPLHDRWGMTRPQFDACLQNQSMIANLKWVKDRGRKLGIVGTPNFFIGTKLIKKELTIAEIADYIEQASRSGTSTAAASP